MKKHFWTLVVIGMMSIFDVNAESYQDMEPLKLETPEMKPELVLGNMPANPFISNKTKVEVSYSDTQAEGMDFDFFKSKTAPGVKPYKFMDEMTFVGVPLFLAGWAIKGDKAMFRVNNKYGKENTQLLTNFKTGIDDYLQFFGPAMTVGLKLGGYEGRSDWPRLLASAGLSYAIMAGFVNGIKYTAKEMRPDGSTANSWPSGHTATAFVGASLLHKEYGLTRSPWFSVAGYGLATATGVMRVLNNRHWISDVMSGAGIGILSTELGYAIGDLLFKGKGLLHNDLQLDSNNPSFFGISMGVGLGSKHIDFTMDDVVDPSRFTDEDLGYNDDVDYESDDTPNVTFRAATVVDAEGAYFLNKYIGIGGRLRVRAMSAKSFGQYTEYAAFNQIWGWYDVIGNGIYNIYNDDKAAEDFVNYTSVGGDPIEELGATVESDHLAEFSGSLGLYFNIPIDKHFSIGSKVLIGRSFTQELDLDGYAYGRKKDINYHLVIDNSDIDKTNSKIDYPHDTGEDYISSWDYLTIGAKSSTTWGTGLSLTYRYKSNFAWRLFCDYDYTEKTFTMTYDPYHYLKDGLDWNAYTLVTLLSPKSGMLEPIEFKKSKKMNYFTLGLSFLVNL
jgi:membrane-associated phospholipid phosphatase